MSGLSRGATAVYMFLFTTLILFATWLVAPSVETRFFPVVEGTEITKVEQGLTGVVTIWGNSVRVRDCNFEGLRWYRGVRNDRAVIVALRFLEKNKIRSGGGFDFGPWEIVLNPEFSLKDTYADALHQCFIFGVRMPWLTRSRFYQ